MDMPNPPHPGEIVKIDCLEPLGLSVERAAQGLGVSYKALTDIVNEKAGISAEMSVRLSKAFGSSPETWLRMQMAYDLWQIGERDEQIEVESFRAHL
jgi:addiction module HigA family antidote